MSNKETVKKLIRERLLLPYMGGTALMQSYYISNDVFEPNDKIDFCNTSISVYKVNGWNETFETILRSEYKTVLKILYSNNMKSIIFTP
jgi:hypothetical protein